MGNYVLSAFADEYSKDLREQLAALRRFGIDFLEVRHVNGKNVSLLSRKEARELKETLDGFGIRASAIGSPLGKIALDGDLDGHFETARQVFETANLLGTPFVRVFSFYPPEGRPIADLRDEVFAAMQRMVLLAREFGITLCHENEARIYGDVPARCKELLDAFGGEIRCVFDMGNFVLEGVDPLPAYRLLKDHVAYFHIKDALAEGAIVPAGTGDAKIREILTEHAATEKEDFFVSLEPHLQTFAGLNALVGREFTNPYRYPDEKTAFTDAVAKFRTLMEGSPV